jgi:ABC-2 type transport system permease protein
MRAIGWVILKELVQIRRDRRLLAMLVVAPVIQLVILGFAATTDVREVAVAVHDYDHSPASREYVRALGASGFLRTRVVAGPPAADTHELVSGRTGLLLVIPPGFGRALADGREAPVQVLVDGSDSNAGVQGLSYLEQATRLHNRRLALAVRPAPRLAAVAAETRVWHNPDLTSTRFMIPAIMGVLLLTTTTLVTSMALVREREQGTLEQLLITPLRPGELIAGKTLPYVMIGFAQFTLALPVVVYLFGVSLRGSLLLLYAGSLLFLLPTLGLGLLVSTLVHTQQQAMLLTAFGVMMPFNLLSGFVFPIANMPPAIQAVTYLIPLRYYLEIVRGIFLRGAGWAELWPQALALFALGAATFALALLKFHKRLD